MRRLLHPRTSSEGFEGRNDHRTRRGFRSPAPNPSPPRTRSRRLRLRFTGRGRLGTPFATTSMGPDTVRPEHSQRLELSRAPASEASPKCRYNVMPRRLLRCIKPRSFLSPQPTPSSLYTFPGPVSSAPPYPEGSGVLSHTDSLAVSDP